MVQSLKITNTNILLMLCLIFLAPSIFGLFLLVGYLIGEKYGDWYGLLGICIGGTIGFITGAAVFLQLLELMGRKQDLRLYRPKA